MPGPNDPTTSNDAQERGRPLNVNEINTGKINITRLDPTTGEAKERQTDLLEAVCACIEEQTETLAEILKGGEGDTIGGRAEGSINRLIAALQGGPGGGGDGDTGGGGGAGDRRSEAEIIGAQRRFRDFQDLIGDTQQEGVKIKDLFKAFRLGVMQEMDEAVADMVGMFRRLGRSVVDTNKGMTILSDSLELSYTGMGTFTDLVTSQFQQLGDVAEALWKRDFTGLSDSVRATAQDLRQMAQQGEVVAPLLEGAKNLETAAQFLRDTRNAVNEDFNFRRVMSDEEANQAIIEQLNLARRAGIQGELSAGEAAKRVQRQSELLASIAQDSGLTVGELMKMTKQARIEIDNRRALGALNETQSEALKVMAAAAGENEAAKVLLGQIAESGGNIVAWQARNPEIAMQMKAAGLMDEMEELFRISNDTSMSDLDRANAMLDVFNRMSTSQGDQARQALAQFGKLEELTNIIGPLGTLPKVIEKLPEDFNDTTVGQVVNMVKDIFKQFGITGELGLAATMVANTFALFKNTAALWANTAAHGAGGLTSSLGADGSGGDTRRGPRRRGRLARLGGKLANMGRGALNFGRGAIGLLGGAGLKAGVGTLAAGGAAGLGTLAAGVGSAGLAGYGIGTLLNDYVVNPLTEKISGKEGQTLGGAIWDFFNADDLAEQRKKEQEEIARIVAERKKAREAAQVGTAPNKGVQPVPTDPATVVPTEAAAQATEQAAAAGTAGAVEGQEDPMLVQAMKQSDFLQQMVLLLTAGNSLTEDMLDKIGGFGSPDTGAAFRSEGAINPRAAAMFSDFQSR